MKSKQPLTEEQRQRRRKMLVYPLMGLLFIFHVADLRVRQQGQGRGAAGRRLQREMPLPVEAGIIADKRTAYEQAKMEEKQKERRTQMNDLAALFSDKDDKAFETQSEEFDANRPEPQQPARTYGGSSPRQPIRSSAALTRRSTARWARFTKRRKTTPKGGVARAHRGTGGGR